MTVNDLKAPAVDGVLWVLTPVLIVVLLVYCGVRYSVDMLGISAIIRT